MHWLLYPWVKSPVTNLSEGRVGPRLTFLSGENHNPLDVQLVVLLVCKQSFSGLEAKLS